MELQQEKGWKALRFLPKAVRSVGSHFSDGRKGRGRLRAREGLGCAPRSGTRRTW